MGCREWILEFFFAQCAGVPARSRGANDMTPSGEQTHPLTLMFADDGSIPNNPQLALLLYRAGMAIEGIANPQSLLVDTFTRNHWGDVWQNGIYPFAHYHSATHEVLGVARGQAKVRLGGDRGEDVDLTAGDIVVLPAGTGHQCLWASPDLLVVGAYPPNGRYDLCRGSKAEHARALAAIPRVPMPDTDPIFGKEGPLTNVWRHS
jgi:uncharacterized protein YjlB